MRWGRVEYDSTLSSPSPLYCKPISPDLQVSSTYLQLSDVSTIGSASVTWPSALSSCLIEVVLHFSDGIVQKVNLYLFCKFRRYVEILMSLSTEINFQKKNKMCTFKLDVTVLHTVRVYRNTLLIMSSRLLSHEQSQLQGCTVLLIWRGFQPLVVGSLYSSRSLFCGRKLCESCPQKQLYRRSFTLIQYPKFWQTRTFCSHRTKKKTGYRSRCYVSFKGFFIYKTNRSGRKALLFREKTPIIFTFPKWKINELVVWTDDCLYMYKTNAKSGMSANNHERQNQRKSLEVIVLENEFTCIFYSEAN